MATTSTTLAAAMRVSDLSAVLTSTTGTATGNTLLIGGEYMTQTGPAVGSIVPLRRGQNGSAQIAHAALAAVTMGLPSDFSVPAPVQAAIFTDPTLTGDGSSSRPLTSSGGTGTVVTSAPLTGDGSSLTPITAASTTGTGAVVLATSPTLVTPVLGVATGTSLTLSGSRILGIPGTDLTAVGNSLASQNAGGSITAMDLVYLDSSATWQQTDADAAATATGFLAISLQTKTVGQAMSVALAGSLVRNDAWNWTPGATLYVSPTAGAITATSPSTTNQIVRVVGFAITADVIWFGPSPDYVTFA